MKLITTIVYFGALSKAIRSLSWSLHLPTQINSSCNASSILKARTAFFVGIDAKDLVLLKVSVFQRATRILWLTLLHFQVAINLDAHDEDSLSHLRIAEVDIVEKLTVWKRVSDYWSLQPDGQIDIFVEPRDTGEHTPCI